MFGLSQIAWEAILAAVVALGIFGGGMKVQHDLDASKYTALELSYTQAQAKAVAAAQAQQTAIDTVAYNALADQANQQQALATALQKELADVQAHISVKTITATCVPYGFLRVLYASSNGVTADSLAVPAGKSDDACSPIGWAQLATEIVHNYGQSLANSAQLNALIKVLEQDQKVLKPAEKK